MPVEDHPVHDSVKRTQPRAGCYNRTGFAPGRWVMDGTLKRWLPHTASKKCRQILALPECEGCVAPKDHEYIEKMRNLK